MNWGQGQRAKPPISTYLLLISNNLTHGFNVFSKNMDKYNQRFRCIHFKFQNFVSVINSVDMSKQDQNDMMNFYPDLSDEDQEKPPNQPVVPQGQPQKLIKLNQGAPPAKPKGMFAMPFLKGFIPPPPPPGKHQLPPSSPYSPPPVYSNNHSGYPNHSSGHSYNPQGFSSHSNPYSHPQSYHQANPNKIKAQMQPRPERQRKNCVFVKNIPRFYNVSDKLMTFFKNEGTIKEIRVNQEQNSAMVRFHKEQNAMKFINSKKAIFNRSFITYSLNEEDPVPAELRKERENQQAGKSKKPIQVEIKGIRQRIDILLADKIRALLFLTKHILQGAALEELKDVLRQSITMKSMLEGFNYQQVLSISKTLSNQFDWTLTFVATITQEQEKKDLLIQLQKNFGPVSSLDFVSIDQEPRAPIDQPVNDQHLPVSYIVKLIFLGTKHALEYLYSSRLAKQEYQLVPDVEIQGNRLKNLFQEGTIKYQFRKLPTYGIPKPQVKQEIKKEVQDKQIQGVEAEDKKGDIRQNEEKEGQEKEERPEERAAQKVKNIINHQVIGEQVEHESSEGKLIAPEHLQQL